MVVSLTLRERKLQIVGNESGDFEIIGNREVIKRRGHILFCERQPCAARSGKDKCPMS